MLHANHNVAHCIDTSADLEKICSAHRASQAAERHRLYHIVFFVVCERSRAPKTYLPAAEQGVGSWINITFCISCSQTRLNAKSASRVFYGDDLSLRLVS